MKKDADTENGQMKDKTCMVTGANSGIGKVTATALAGMGAHTILTCRNRAKGEAALEEIKKETGNPAAELMLADFASLSEVRKLAEDFLANHDQLHVLVNNAGLILTDRRETEDGHEATFGINHLAPFLLTNLLLDRIKDSTPARIVNVSSEAHRVGRMNFDDLQFAKTKYHSFKAYAASKLANILFTTELSKKLEGTSVTTNCLHPGTIRSGFGRETSGFFKFILTLGKPFLIGPVRGAKTSIHLATSPKVENITGKYFIRRRVRRPSKRARSEDDARRLWEVSAEMVGI